MITAFVRAQSNGGLEQISIKIKSIKKDKEKSEIKHKKKILLLLEMQFSLTEK